MFRFTRFPGGVHPRGNKHAHSCPTVYLDQFKTVRIPMLMHIGPPCTPVVQPGDRVEVGQIIGQPVGALAAPIHASVSGTVRSVRKEVASIGSPVDVVEIESDGKETVHESIKPPIVRNKAEFIQAIRDSGLVGLGGAGFPTHMKMRPPAGKEPDILVINAAECEPYISTDFRLCIEHPDEIINGIMQVMKYMDIPRALIGIENNKILAADILNEELMKIRLNANLRPNIKVVQLRTLYPQGAEKMLVYALTGRKIPAGGLPHDAKVMVLNVGTVRFISKYLKDGLPLIRRQITLAGSCVRTPGNLSVPIGARIPDIIEAAGGLSEEAGKVLMGGSMMGVALDRLDASIIKNNNAILIYNRKEAAIPPETQCIRCARCVFTCPMKLMPTVLDNMARNKDIEGLRQYHVQDCIECGCCTFVCPAKRYLVQSIRNGKAYVKNAQAKEAAAK
ncbi:MAG TPA: electron transport complex subunit RsxC [Clostridiales bacterium]|nr:electron transport complex subunit RsxC [Clostridiales bacterium]